MGDRDTASAGREKAQRARRSGRAAVGHPVDIASGEQFTAAHDVEVAGVSPLIFRRVYNTSFLAQAPSVLGPGWVHAFEASLTRDLDGFVFEGHDGERVEFDDVALDFAERGRLYNPAAAMELRREGHRLVVYHWHEVHEAVQKYVFDARDGERMLLVARELPSGQGLEIGRDRQGRVATVTQISERRRLYLSYDRLGRIESLRLGLASGGIEQANVVARYRYDERSRLVAVQNALGAEQRYAYDDAGRLTLEQDRRGGIYRMRYDGQGRCIETGGEDGYQLRRLVYEPGRTTRVIDSLGRETLYQFNELGQVERRVDPNGSVYVTEFDAAGRIARQVDAIGATTEYEYDAVGHLLAKTFPNGARISYEYDDVHQPVKIVEPDGAVWSFGYERGALVEFTDPLGRRLRYVRDRGNEIIGVLSSSGQDLAVHTNETWTEETISDQHGLLIQRRLDVYLNPTSIQDGRGPVRSCEYDGAGRLVRSKHADGSTRGYEYDGEGKVTRLIDARGEEWRARYSNYGNCLEQVDPLGRKHRFQWDGEGRLTAIENSRHEHASLEYDLVGNLASVRHFDGGAEEFRRDAAGRIIGRKRPDGSELRFARDIVGNLLAIHCGQVELRCFEYDLCGSPLSARSPDAQTSFEYDVGGRVRAEVQNGRRIEYEYSARGFLSQRRFEGSRVGALSFEHDSRGRLRRIATDQGQIQAYRYDNGNLATERELGSIVEHRQYDLRGRLGYQEIGGLNSRTFQYDAEGALTEVLDKLRGRRQYVYDAAEQLLESIHEKLGISLYRYDENGNLSDKDAGSLAYDSGNRLRTLGAARLERDANGQVIRCTSSTRDDRYEWDALGQLVRVQHGDGAQTRFGYDAYGRRVFKHHQPTATACEAPRAGRTDYYWSGDDLLAEARGEHLTEYAIWNFVAEAIWEDGALRHVVSSQQGVPQELIDEHGQLVWQGTFDDWGKLIAETGTTTCRLRLPGQIADDETGLHYNRFRYYWPEAGQFLSADPIGFSAGTNEYRFAPNGINWIDPLGLKCGQNGCKTYDAGKVGPDPDPSGPAGVVYLRRDTTGNVSDYVGQAKSWERFGDRTGEHAADFPGSKFEFTVLDRAAPGTALDVAEESWMRAGGGASAINPATPLSNTKAMNDARYRAGNGNVPKP